MKNSEILVSLILYLLASATITLLIAIAALAYFQNAGADKLGDLMLAMGFSPLLGLLLGIPVSVFLYRFENRRSNSE